MKLPHRIQLLKKLGDYLGENSPEWQEAKNQAFLQNQWFVPDFIEHSIDCIIKTFLQENLLEHWANHYKVPVQQSNPLTIGLTMAGNIPLVGFHDFLTIFMSGHKLLMKPSSKDMVLISHIIKKMTEWDAKFSENVGISDRLQGCDAYIATGSNNSARYFEYYFGKYPHIIRRNRTSVAILQGNETAETLHNLADDMMMYFGLGCRSISKLYVPEGYNWENLLGAFKKYQWMKDHSKFRNNYDYILSLHILNNQYYMSNDIFLLVESKELFSPISQVNYEYFTGEFPQHSLTDLSNDIQCICGGKLLPFGQAQSPGLFDYADGVDTMAFACSLTK